MNRQNDEHDDIARRLRETGIVRAPEEVRPDVMRTVRLEARGRRRPWLASHRPQLLAAAALVVVVAAVVAIATLGGGGGGSAAGGGSASRAAGAASGGGALQKAPSASKRPPKVYTVEKTAVQPLLGPLSRPPRNGVIVVRAPEQQYVQVRRLLSQAARVHPPLGNVTVKLLEK
jgi:hypothetical protein